MEIHGFESTYINQNYLTYIFKTGSFNRCVADICTQILNGSSGWSAVSQFGKFRPGAVIDATNVSG